MGDTGQVAHTTGVPKPPTAEDARAIQRDVVVVGASAGGVQALETLFGSLPADLPASVLVVLHLKPTGRSGLDSILSRAGGLPASAARDGMRLERGHAYVAIPDRHLLVDGETIRLGTEPRENGFRPAADALFLSAARAFGPRLLAVVLTGALDDGAEGLRLVRDHGGATIVQDPEDAAFADMPRNAIDRVEPDLIVPLPQLGQAVLELISGARRPDPQREALRLEDRAALLNRMAERAGAEHATLAEERLRARARAAADRAAKIRARRNRSGAASTGPDEERA